MSTQAIIKVKDLHKYYKDVKAVNGVGMEIYEGEIFGMVGPNGAGKTTTIECIEGLRAPDKGAIEVLGLSPQKDNYILKKQIGIQLQEGTLPHRIKVKEVMKLFASFYPNPMHWQSLLKQVGLEDKENSYYEKLSGGQKKRLHIALSLIGNPKIIFFDELTTGLDPQARRNTWDMILQIRKEGKTIFLTTHYMEEAQELCDRVCIIDYGKIVALDKPQSLIQNLDVESKVIFTLDDSLNLKILQDLPCVSKVEKINGQVIVYGKEKNLLTTVVQVTQSQGVSLQNLEAKQPTLEDVFIALTGREYRD